MKEETFLDAQEKYKRYKLCEALLEYLSDPDKAKGMKYKELLATFAKEFDNDFMMFVHTKMEEAGMQFENIKDCDCDKQPEANPEPTDPKDPKFPIGSKVEIVSGVGKGDVGYVKDFGVNAGNYYVVSQNFSMWFAESELRAYAEEGQEPENSEDNDAE